MSARGNSGVIISQVVGGLCDVVIEREAESVDTAMLVECLERGAAKARASVAHPQEGTHPHRGRCRRGRARAAGDAGGSMSEVSAAAVEAATEALAHTPEQLPALARAGVVDAGGAGCVLLLEALHRVVTRAAGPPPTTACSRPARISTAPSGTPPAGPRRCPARRRTTPRARAPPSR